VCVLSIVPNTSDAIIFHSSAYCLLCTRDACDVSAVGGVPTSYCNNENNYKRLHLPEKYNDQRVTFELLRKCYLLTSITCRSQTFNCTFSEYQKTRITIRLKKKPNNVYTCNIRRARVIIL